MTAQATRLGLAALLTVFAGCVGPGLEPPKQEAAGAHDSHADGGAGEPINGPSGTTGGNAGTKASAPLDGGVENIDAASDSSTDDDAGT